MKSGASILFVIISFFTIQPIVKVEQKKIPMQCCTKASCSKKMPEQNKKTGCGGMACNPLIGCPYYNLFFVNKFSVSVLLPIAKEKIFVSNDNRIIKANAEFWHPPEA
ncbi:MAG: hypothetical protein ABJA37_14635 [Ferruginibacter sp.]